MRTGALARVAVGPRSRVSRIRQVHPASPPIVLAFVSATLAHRLEPGGVGWEREVRGMPDHLVADGIATATAATTAW